MLVAKTFRICKNFPVSIADALTGFLRLGSGRSNLNSVNSVNSVSGGSNVNSMNSVSSLECSATSISDGIC